MFKARTLTLVAHRRSFTAQGEKETQSYQKTSCYGQGMDISHVNNENIKIIHYTDCKSQTVICKATYQAFD